MKRKLIPLFIFTLLVMKMGFSQQKNFIDQPYLEVTASVDSLVTPDEIYLNILITEKDTKGKVSVEELERQMIKSLETLGIDTKKQLKLSDVASNFKRFFLSGQEVLKSKNYQLKVGDAKMAGKVLVALEQADIANVNIEKVEFSKLEELKKTLLIRVVNKAKEQAEAMVAPLSQQVGKALYISETQQYVQPYESRQMLSVRGAVHRGNDEAPEIDFEKIKVEKTVMVRFVLE